MASIFACFARSAAKLPGAFAIIASLVCAGCATAPGSKGRQITVYDVRAIARLAEERPELERSQARRLADIEARVEAVAGVHVDRFAVAQTFEINAAAMVKDGKNWLMINKPLLRLLGDDDDALAALIGHELAHLALGHAESRRNVGNVIEAGNQVLGVFANLAVPGSGHLLNLGGTALKQAYSRDQERDADAAGLDYAVRAGYAPAGMLRLMNLLPVGHDGGATGFFDSHPGKVERIDHIDKLIRERYARP